MSELLTITNSDHVCVLALANDDLVMDSLEVFKLSNRTEVDGKVTFDTTKIGDAHPGRQRLGSFEVSGHAHKFYWKVTVKEEDHGTA